MSVVLLLASVGLVAAGVGLLVFTSEFAAGDRVTIGASGSSSGSSIDGSTASTAARPALSAQAADPIGVRIPRIGVEASTTPLGLRPDGSIEVPQDFQQTGWWRDGPEPGEIGPAVILGHVDSFEGPAVFFELRSLSVGDEIHVDRVDGSTVTFVVDRIEQHPKALFPTDDVYGRTDNAQLRLVTCGGAFDRDERSYEDNIIVFASAPA